MFTPYQRLWLYNERIYAVCVIKDTVSQVFSYVIEPRKKYMRLIDITLWYVIAYKLKASAHSFKRFTSRLLKLSFSLSMHLLPRMNVMLDLIWTLPVQLRGTRNKWTLSKNLVHGRIWTTNTARLTDYKSTVITTRP